MNTAATSFAENLQQNNPAVFEQCIIAAVNGDADTFAKVAPILCISPTTGEYQNEFDSSAHYAIYIAISEWRRFLASTPNTTFTPISKTTIHMELLELSGKYPNIIEPAMVAEYANVFERIVTNFPIAEAVPVVTAAFDLWVERKKAFILTRHSTRTGMEDPSKLVAGLQEVQKQVSCNVVTSRSVFGDGLFDNEVDVKRLKLSTKFDERFNACLGGGFGEGEASLVIAPTGGGKTVLACQFCSDLALSGHTCLYITTEQKPPELQLRMLSDCCNIPFDTIKDGGKWYERAEKKSVDAVHNMLPTLSRRLLFDDWSVGSGKTVDRDLEPSLEAWMAQSQDPVELLCFDWIGGALDITKDKDMLRIIYQNAATKLKNIAMKYNIAVVVFAQATPTSTGKKHLSEADIAECKSMHREFTNAFGVSAVRTGERDEAFALYAPVQWVNCFKSRKSQGLSFPVKRDFSFQRFAKV